MSAASSTTLWTLVTTQAVADWEFLLAHRPWSDFANVTLPVAEEAALCDAEPISCAIPARFWGSGNETS